MSKPSALVGYTGFVGGNLLKQNPGISALFNSKNFHEMEGRSFSTVFFSGARAEKWKANQDPKADLEHIDSLIRVLRTIQCERFILISTVDVYPKPIGVDESLDVWSLDSHAYGKNRARLERFVLDTFGDKALVIRLPALFGKGLKKNAIYDFLNNNEVHKIDTRGAFQFYDLERLTSDIELSLKNGLKVVNFATEPLELSLILKEAFKKDFENHVLPSPARYDFKTRHSRIWGSADGYIMSRADVLKAISRFVSEYHAG